MIAMRKLKKFWRRNNNQEKIKIAIHQANIAFLCGRISEMKEWKNIVKSLKGGE